MKSLAFALLALPLLAGCASSAVSAAADCSTFAVMRPAAATADHSANAPANSTQFSVAFSGNCAVTALAYLPPLKSSDTINISIPSAGVAQCVGTTTVPAILTDTRSGTTSTLTCK